MGDTNENNKKESKTRKSSYTNLGGAYKIKLIILLFVALITVAFADTFEMTLIGALTTLSGIGFDLAIVSISNYGPRQKYPRRAAKFASYTICGICFFIILYFITKDTSMTNSIRAFYLSAAKEYAYIGCLIIKGFIVTFSVAGPLTEYYFNKPDNHSDDEEGKEEN